MQLAVESKATAISRKTTASQSSSLTTASAAQQYFALFADFALFFPSVYSTFLFLFRLQTATRMHSSSQFVHRSHTTLIFFAKPRAILFYRLRVTIRFSSVSHLNESYNEFQFGVDGLCAIRKRTAQLIPNCSLFAPTEIETHTNENHQQRFALTNQMDFYAFHAAFTSLTWIPFTFCNRQFRTIPHFVPSLCGQRIRNKYFE